MTAAQVKIREWRARPEKFVYEQFGVEADPWQLKVLQAFADPSKPRISMQACAGPGKTAVESWCVWNFLSCYAEKGEHPKGAGVSITGDNLDMNLWPELAKWQGRSAFLSHAFTWTKTRVFANDFPADWFFAARSWPKSATPDEQGKTLSGIHGKFILFVIDESGAIPPTVLRAAEQALATSPAFGKILQAGNTLSLEGMLFVAATTLRGQWLIIEVTGDPDDPEAWVNAPSVLARAGTGPRDWAREQIDTYGRDNPWVQAYILGKFPKSSLNTLLSMEDVQAAMARSYPDDVYRWAQARLGADVARYGDDRTVIFPRQGKRAFLPKIMRHARESAVSTDIATAIMAKRLEFGGVHVPVIMDATGGWAAGASDVLRASDPAHAPVNIQFHAKGPDPRYKNYRAQLYFAGAEWVKAGGWLPNVPELVGEATAATYTFINGQFQIEPKEQIKARLGKSPDIWEGFLLTFGTPEIAPVEAATPYVPPKSAWG